MINCSAASVGGGIYRRAREREGILLNARREAEVDFRASQTNAAVESERQRQLLSATLASIGDGVIVTDSLGKITFMNPEAQRLTGWVGDDARGRSFTEVCRIVDPVNRERLGSSVEKVLRTGTKVGLAKRAVLIARDGKETVIDKSGSPVRRESGEIDGVVIVIRDFAEREAADRALRESEERFRQSIEAGSLGTFVHHIETDLLECDERSREHFGVSGKGPLSEVTRRLHPDDRERVAAAIALAWDPVRSDGRCREEYRLIESDGTVKWLLVQARVFFEGEGEARHAARGVGVTQDITARHRDEQALRDSESRLSNVIESLAEGIIVANPVGNTMQLQWNRAALALHDYGSVEEVRRPLQEVNRDFELSPVEGGAPLPHEQWPIPRLVRGETVRGVELRFRRLDREFERIYSYGGTRVSDAAGNLQFVLLTITDITHQSEAQISLRQAKEHAESAGRAKDHFLAVVSHELRTPLTPVLVATSELQSRGDLPADVRHDLEMVRRNVELEARLVDDLLTLTRLHRGKIVLHQETINVHSIVRAVVEQFHAEIENKRLELTLALSAIDPHVWADATRFQQALSNLLSNAVKFTPDGGKVSLRSLPPAGNCGLRCPIPGSGSNRRC